MNFIHRTARPRLPRQRFIESLEARLLLTMVKDINPGAADGYTGAGQIALNGDLIFSANDGTTGSQPWISDGTSAGTHLLKKDQVNPAGNAAPSEFTVGNGVVYFTAYDGTSYEIWKTDGTDDGTVPMTDFGGAAIPSNLAYVNGNLVFFTIITDTPALWKLNPTGGETFIDTVTITENLGIARDQLFYKAQLGNGDQKGLWSTDGVSNKFVRAIDNIYGASASFGFTNWLLFRASTNDGVGYELWSSDGTSTGTHRLGNPINGVNGSFPGNFAATSDDTGNHAFFTAQNSTGYQIYRTDGLEVVKATDFPSSTVDNPFASLINFGDLLYFIYTAPTGSKGASGIYKMPVGKTPQLVVSTASNSFKVHSLTNVGGHLYFIVADGFSSFLYALSNTGTPDPLEGIDESSNPSALTVVPSPENPLVTTLFFSSHTIPNGAELHVINADAAPSSRFTARLKVDRHSLDEGGAVQFTAVVTGFAISKCKFRWDFNGDGTLVNDGYKPLHIYADNLLNNATRNARVKVIAPDGRYINAYAEINVSNVAPVIKRVTMPSAFVPFQPMPFEVIISEPGLLDETRVSINWSDGIEVYTPVKGVVRDTHTFRGTGGPETIDARILAADHDNATAVKRRTLTIQPILVQPDAGALALGVPNMVLAGGTNSPDKIHFHLSPTQPAGGNVAIDFSLNGAYSATITVNPTRPFLVNAGSGADRFFIDAAITNPMVLYGGSGNDIYNLGGGSSTVKDNLGHNLVRNAGADDVIKIKK